MTYANPGWSDDGQCFVWNEILVNPDPPATQELPLAVREVLIQYVHAVTGSETSFGA